MTEALLRNKNAVVYGAAGAIGGAIAKAFAGQGARVFLTGRRLAKVQATASRVAGAGGAVDAAQVDALDEQAVEQHLDAVVKEAGRIDISLNAVGFDEIQGVPLTDLSLEDFMFPIVAWSKTVFLTSRAAARRMTQAGSGVILTLHAPLGNEALGGGFPAACAAIQTITRTLAGEVGPYGVRVLSLQPNAIPESDSLRRSVALYSGGNGADVDATLLSMARATLLRRLPTLDEVATVAAFIASDHAGIMTGTAIKLNCGSRVD
jgi:NAD(P)-dependent dehydrogenase (short-subunit alcohol dehydrogenase family)